MPRQCAAAWRYPKWVIRDRVEPVASVAMSANADQVDQRSAQSIDAPGRDQIELFAGDGLQQLIDTSLRTSPARQAGLSDATWIASEPARRAGNIVNTLVDIQHFCIYGYP